MSRHTLTKPARDILISSVSAVLLMAICMVIRPAGLSVNYGLSYYGTLKTTIVPYTLIFMLSAFFYWRAAKGLSPRRRLDRSIAPILQLMALLLIGLAATPHTLFDSLHVAFGSALFSLQLLLSLWILYTVKSKSLYVCLIAVEFLSGLAAMYYLPLHHGFMIQAEIIFQLAFGTLLIRALDSR